MGFVYDLNIFLGYTFCICCWFLVCMHVKLSWDFKLGALCAGG